MGLGFCFGCCGSAVINVPSISCGGTLTGVLFELLDATGTTTLQSSTGSSASFTVSSGSGYKIRVSKTGYHTRTSSTVTPTAGSTTTVTITTWPTSYTLPVHVVLHDSYGDCPLSGASVSISGDGSGSGTTDALGNVSITLSSSSSSSLQSLSYSITPPAGIGAATKTGSFSVSACGASTQNVTIIPDASHVAEICNGKYMPSTLTWTDDYGSCTLSYYGAGWSGTYTYNTTGLIEYTCATGGFPPTFTAVYSDRPVSVTVNCGFGSVSRSSCSSTTFSIIRSAWFGEAIVCATSTWRCQPLDDSLMHLYGGILYMTPVADVSASCSTSLSFSFSIGAQSAVQCSTYADTAVSVAVTGSI